MWDKVKQFLAPPSFPLDEGKTWSARLIDGMLWLILIVSLVGSAVMVILEPADALFNALFGVFLVTLIFFGRIVLRRGHVYAVGIGVMAVLWLSVAFLVVQSGGLRSQVMNAYYLILIISGSILGSVWVLPIGALNLVWGIMLYIGENQGWIANLDGSHSPLNELAIYILVMSLSVVLLWLGLLDVERWIGRSVAGEATLAERNAELSSKQASLTVYTQTVERRFAYLEATARTTQILSTFLDLDALFTQLAKTVAAEFHFEHVAVYELTEDRLQAQLRSISTSQQLVTQVDTLLLSDVPALESVVWRIEPYICQDKVQDSAFLDHPEWPVLNSALLLPLLNTQEGKVFGVLLLATADIDAFGVQDALVLQALADQIALVVGYARLFAELQSNLFMAKQASEEVSRESWAELLHSKTQRVYRYLDEEASTADSARVDLPELTRSLRVRGRVLGKLVAHKPEGRGDWTTEESTIINTLLAQLEQALEGARLYDITQRRALRERMTRELTDYIRSSLSIEQAMERAVREIAKVLRASETVARIGSEDSLLQNQTGAGMGDGHE